MTATTSDETKQQEQSFGAFMCYIVTYFRGLESAREDRLFNDPFAEPLARKAAPKLAPIVALWANDQKTHPKHYMSVRTRYVEDAINARDPSNRQVVLLGAGLDARAFYLESLRGCHVFEIDQSEEIFAHKKAVMKELAAPLVAAKHDMLIADLTQPGWKEQLLACGFDPSVPTFWNIEGLLMYIDQELGRTILTTIDSMSAPGSEFFGDMVGHVLVKEVEVGSQAMAHGEDDPLNGIYSEIGWNLELTASLHEPATHFGREWTPMLSAKTQTPVRFDFMVGKKPATTS
ncbi:hypothetical protein BBJ28_00004469 [Nothophytophthora sp. Chile5]|nr:hypothetical protein BBJ28_00004469 [Nothophytophthora sp. Chile5]